MDLLSTFTLLLIENGAQLEQWIKGGTRGTNKSTAKVYTVHAAVFITFLLEAVAALAAMQGFCFCSTVFQLLLQHAV